MSSHDTAPFQPFQLEPTTLANDEVLRLMGTNRRLEEKCAALERQQQEAARLVKCYAAVSKVHEAILQEPDHSVLLGTVCRALVEHGPFDMAWVGFRSESGDGLVPQCSFGKSSSFIGEIESFLRDKLSLSRPIQDMLHGVPLAFSNDLANEKENDLAHLNAFFKQYAIRSNLVVALKSDDQLLGGLAVYSSANYSL